MTLRPQILFTAALLSVPTIGAMTGTAQAYLDPGTGSMILQLLLGGIAGMAVVLKLYWHRVKALFGRGVAKDTVLENDGPDATT